MANALQIEFLNDGVNYQGEPLASGTVYFYTVGTLNAKNAYRDAAKTDPVSSVTLGADGRPQDGAGDATAMYGDGTYRIIIKDSSAVTIIDIDNLFYQIPTATTLNISTVSSSPYTASTTSEVILVTTGAGAIQVNLPAATTSGIWKKVIKVDSGAGTAVINRAGTDTIYGATSKTLTSENDQLDIVANGTTVWEGDLKTSVATIGEQIVLGASKRFESGVHTTFRGALAYNSGAQAITEGNDVDLTFDTQLYDTDDIWEGVTNPTRMTVPSGVSYIKLFGYVYFDDEDIDAGNLLHCGFTLNGNNLVHAASTVAMGSTIMHVGGAGAESGHLVSTPAIPVLTPGTDYFEFTVHFTGGDAIATAAPGEGPMSGGVPAWFAMEIIN